MCIADGVQTVIHMISGIVTIMDWEIPYHANIVSFFFCFLFFQILTKLRLPEFFIQNLINVCLPGFFSSKFGNLAFT
jgi:hypothetical protein